MTKTQSVVIPWFSVTCLALSPDSKTLVLGDLLGRIRLLQTYALSIQIELNTIRGPPTMAIALDPTCRVLGFGCLGGTLELRTLI
jgi:hypothetical protein